jgi:hypothetical protein
MPLDSSTFFRAADPEDILPGPSARLIGTSRLESRVETRAEVCCRGVVLRVSGVELMALDLALARAADAEPGPRQYLQPF